MLLRARVASFLAGAAIAGAFAFYQLRQDLVASQQVLLDQVRTPVLGTCLQQPPSPQGLRQCAWPHDGSCHCPFDLSLPAVPPQIWFLAGSKWPGRHSNLLARKGFALVVRATEHPRIVRVRIAMPRVAMLGL